MDLQKNVFNYGMDTAKSLEPKAEATTQSGLNAMDSVKQFFTNIMSGSRPAQFAALAPESNAINAQSDAARTSSAAFGTARGGGTAPAAVNADTARMKAIDDALFGLRPQAAQNVATIGGKEADIGMEQLSAALKSLGLSDEAISHYVSAALNQRQQNANAWNTALKLGSSVAGAFV